MIYFAYIVRGKAGAIIDTIELAGGAPMSARQLLDALKARPHATLIETVRTIEVRP